ncbi:MAG TPA: transposase [Povalibacter sp.]|uniref:REP-associated tyrosine transposase n=1 Tax=Povalibacter sp. TaxID=1962978 RepID=UPI002C3D1F23|nr:transposase [Povalibacter sp.]HMN44989.1 transposase [Povalibacter sp.]
MPRPLRLHVPGAFYHVTLRGNHRQNIFFKPADRDLFNEIAAEVIERFTTRLHAYCLMTNHVHLLIQVGEVPLGRLMLRIAGRYARAIQRQLHTTGHLFEKRYHPVIVDADEYLLELLRYIHLNPLRARMVDAAEAYRWSSHHAYLGTRTEPWVTTDFALSMFHSNRAQAVAAYDRFVGECPDVHSPLNECNVNDRRILGSDEFAGKLLGDAWQAKSRKTLHELMDDAAHKFSISHESLLSPSRQRHLSKARAWVAYEAISLRIASLSQVARLLQRDESSLRAAIQRYFPR